MTGLNSSLNVWYNLLVKHSYPRVFFVGKFVVYSGFLFFHDSVLVDFKFQAIYPFLPSYPICS